MRFIDFNSTLYPERERRNHTVKLPAHRAGLPGNVDRIIGSALTPVLEFVAALSAPDYRQEGGASSRLARESRHRG